MSGLDLLGELRSRAPGTPVAVMTAFASVDYAVEALRRDADEFLVKPVAAATLLERITALAAEGRAKRRGRGLDARRCSRSARTPTTWRSASAPRSPRTARRRHGRHPHAVQRRDRRRRPVAPARGARRGGHHRRAALPARLRGHPARPGGRAHHDDRGPDPRGRPDGRLHAQRARPAPGPPRRPAGRRRRRPPGPVARVLPEPVVDHRLPAHAASCPSTASSRPSCRCSPRSSRSRTATTWTPTSCARRPGTGRGSAPGSTPSRWRWSARPRC